MNLQNTVMETEYRRKYRDLLNLFQKYAKQRLKYSSKYLRYSEVIKVSKLIHTEVMIKL